MRYKTKHPLYNTYRNMRARCNNSKAANYKWYGGRGIKVCKRWEDSFQSWLDDLGPKPEEKWVLVRLDVDGAYEPANCQWGPKGSEPRRKTTPVNWEYALRLGVRLSRPLGSLDEAKSRRDRLVAEALEKDRQVALEIVRRANGGEWKALA